VSCPAACRVRTTSGFETKDYADDVNTGWSVVLVLSGGAFLYNVISILRLRFLIKRYYTHRINLEKPEQAELFIKDFLSRYPSGDVGANG